MKVSLLSKVLTAVTLLLLVVCSSGELFAASGKIAGQVVDAESGDPLPGVNIIIVGSTMGAATDADGVYFIINVPPGTYSVRADIIGYRAVVQTEVQVSVNLTTTVDFVRDYALKAESVEGEEVTIVADRPIVQADMSASIANVSSAELENLPIAGVDQALELQAGVEPGLVIRGGGLDQVSFNVDGVSMRDARNNNAYTTVSFTAIEEFQLQTGGFNAEYGNLRSGLVNVVTKDPSKTRFHADAFVRYRSSPNYSFGDGPKGDNAYYWRPYTDPSVAFTGTDNGQWDRYTQRQYIDFSGGWNALAEGALGDDDPTNDLTAQQYQDLFFYHHRKDTEVKDNEHTIDFTLSGPLAPNQALGGLRFLASYRSAQEPYYYPQARTSFTEDYFQGKVLSDINNRMKLEVSGMWSKQEGMAFDAFETVQVPGPQRGGIPTYPWGDISSGLGNPAVFSDDNGKASMVNDNRDHVGRSVVFGEDRYSVADVTRNMIGAAFTHTLSSSSFYKASLHRQEAKYNSSPNRRRNFDPVMQIGPGSFDEAPFGWTSNGTSNPGSGLRLGGHWARARDTSVVGSWTGKFDYTTQANRYAQFKLGAELIFNDFDMNYGSDDSVIVHLERSRQKYQVSPFQGALYAQTKLEFKGMIANIGLRADYFRPGADQLVYSPFDRAWTASNAANRADLLTTETPDNQLTLSPRVGISFPITVNSKFYFNYGHFRQLLDIRQLYQVEVGWLSDLQRIGDPSQPFSKTVAYEVGYEQNVFNQYLLRLSGYYRDNENQPRNVQFVSIDNLVNYYQSFPFNYSDVRGFEISIGKNRGNWFRGFLNYTFMQFKSGNFGLSQLNQNVVTQNNYLLTNTDHYLNRPVSQPYASMNLEFFTPTSYGTLLGDWRVDFLGSWRAGQVFTWVGPGVTIPGLSNNARMVDFWGLDMRINKNFTTSFGQLQLYVDVNNLFNLKQMYFDPNNASGGPFESGNSERDWEDYMRSLHLDNSVFKDIEGDISSATGYTNIPGNDRPGARRKDDAAFVPIEAFPSADGFPADGPGFLEPDRRVLYYDGANGTYHEWNGSSWVAADQGFVNQVLDDKAYIDMPNETDRTFLNPRYVRFGFRVSF